MGDAMPARVPSRREKLAKSVGSNSTVGGGRQWRARILIGSASLCVRVRVYVSVCQPTVGGEWTSEARHRGTHLALPMRHTGLSIWLR